MTRAESKTVLVVDDDKVACDALVRLLMSAGYRTATAHDGSEALHRIHGQPKPSLVILDLVMPVLDGWSFCEEMRGDGEISDIPVIVCSGAPANLQQSGGVALNAHAFHPKPIDADALLDSVRRLCS